MNARRVNINNYYDTTYENIIWHWFVILLLKISPGIYWICCYAFLEQEEVVGLPLHHLPWSYLLSPSSCLQPPSSYFSCFPSPFLFPFLFLFPSPSWASSAWAQQPGSTYSLVAGSRRRTARRRC